MLEEVVRPRGPYLLALSARGAGDATRTFYDGVFETTLTINTDFLVKPFSPLELLPRLRSLVTLKRFADEHEHSEHVILTLARMIEVGRALKDEDGANAIVMGCAGMARHRKPLEDALGIPVIDPTQAAVTMALGVVQLGRAT